MHGFGGLDVRCIHIVVSSVNFGVEIKFRLSDFAKVISLVYSYTTLGLRTFVLVSPASSIGANSLRRLAE